MEHAFLVHIKIISRLLCGGASLDIFGRPLCTQCAQTKCGVHIVQVTPKLLWTIVII